MASSVNKVILVGHLGRDPEVRATPSGVTVANLALATSRSWKDKQTGEKQEETEWHRVVLYDRLAEVAGDYLKKGALVYIEGELKTRKWTDKDGVERYTTEIQGRGMQMLGGKAADDGSEPRSKSSPEYSQPAASQNAPKAASQGKAAAKPASNFDDIDDDIPF